MSRPFTFIAEVKTSSPFGWSSDRSWRELFELANKYGDIISIHTDERWGGSFELLEQARRLTTKPILAKGLHEDDTLVMRALEAGADWVLVVGRVPAVNLARCMIEPRSLQELGDIPKDAKAVWNSRDLDTGGLKSESFEQARNTWGGWLCQASNIRTIEDVQPGADAILVGGHLPAFVRSAQL
jgi:indole-3-glycerol phosphate synthase